MTKRLRRYICRLRGHQWGPNTVLQDGKTYRGCQRCPDIDVLMPVAYSRPIWVPVIGP